MTGPEPMNDPESRQARPESAGLYVTVYDMRFHPESLMKG